MLDLVSEKKGLFLPGFDRYRARKSYLSSFPVMDMQTNPQHSILTYDGIISDIGCVAPRRIELTLSSQKPT